MSQKGAAVTRRTAPEYRCSACGRRQLALSARTPKGLAESEAKIIGWMKVDRETGWLCPLCAPGGERKLVDIALAGLSGDKKRG